MANDGGIFGRYGYDEITTSDGNSGSWFAIKAVGGADAEVDITNTQGDSSTALTIISGDVIYCSASSIDVNSGTIHAYRNKP